MVKDEIVIGLQNAVQRGESLEKAMASFFNAGYNLQEVQQAAGEVQSGMGAMAMLQTQQNQENQEFLQRAAMQPEKKRFLIPIIITAIVLVLVGLGILVYFIMK